MQKVSVAMCTYNGERYVREQLNSIAAQTLRPVELVICDDGSADRTLEIASEFARTVDFDVKIVRNQVNLGSTKNFEQSIGLCSGELIALCDQDDVWHPARLECLSEPMNRDTSLGGVFCDAILIDEHSRPTGESLWQVFAFGAAEQTRFERGDAAKLLCIREVVTGATMMFRAALRPHLLPIHNSWIHDGWLSWMLVFHSRLGFVPERLMGYRVHSAQQAGVPPRTLRTRLRKLRTSEAAVCREKASRFKALESRYAELGHCDPEIVEDIRRVIELCELRADLPAGAVRRAMRIFSKLPWYRAYTNGFRTAMRDLVQR
jgi:glycosyltransferase involved in cell wall biosynthesis